ncbi:MAG: ThiF family adenylyltransferase [Bdellovibrionota bacterium]
MFEDNANSLSPSERHRYLRHLGLAQVGEAGQQRLKRASVLLVGTGGLGSPAGLYLAAAGVGRLGLVDFDRVELSNLQRQVLYGEQSVGQPKVEAASRRLSDLNPHTKIEAHSLRLDATNAQALFANYDFILDGSDNFATRYLVNDTCVRLHKVFVHASVAQFRQISTFDSGVGPLLPLPSSPPPPEVMLSRAEAGVLGVLPGDGDAASVRSHKLISETGEPPIGRLQLFDGSTGSFREMALQKDPNCSVCGKGTASAWTSADSWKSKTHFRSRRRNSKPGWMPERPVSARRTRAGRVWLLRHLAGTIHPAS